MHNATELISAIKRAALDAVEASKPSDFCFGKVESISPLKIKIEQKLILSASQLVLCRNVTDYKAEITVDWNTEKSDSHTHLIEGRKEITVHNALAVNDKVVLIRQKGGQKYLVLDKVVNVP